MASAGVNGGLAIAHRNTFFGTDDYDRARSARASAQFHTGAFWVSLGVAAGTGVVGYLLAPDGP